MTTTVGVTVVAVLTLVVLEPVDSRWSLVAKMAASSGFIAVGAAAFSVSDLAVARDRFVTPGIVNRAWGLPLYYGGQILFALAAGE